MTILARGLMAAILSLSLSPWAQAYGPAGSSGEEAAPGTRQFTFAWPYTAATDMKPRGGTTTGEGINLATGVSDEWRSLREPGLAKKERDRRAILAMAGPYRTSFDFIETVGFTEGYSPDVPYQS